MRLFSKMLIGLGLTMVLAMAGGIIWLIWQIGPRKVLVAPDIQISLGWPSMIYLIIAFGSLCIGVWINRKTRRAFTDAVS